MDLLREKLLWNTQRNPTAEAFSFLKRCQRKTRCRFDSLLEDNSAGLPVQYEGESASLIDLFFLYDFAYVRPYFDFNTLTL